MTWSQPYLGHQVDPHTIANADFAVLMESILVRGKPFRFRAAGFSMNPFIKDGDVITLLHPTQRAIKCGSVAAFISPLAGRLAVHRIVDQKGGTFLIKGDNSRQPDGWVSTADIIGVVIRVERGGKPIRFGGGWARGVLACLSKYNILQFSLGLIYAIYRRLFSGVTYEQRQKN